MYPLLLSIIGVSYTKNPGYTLENPKWVERVVILTIRLWRMKSMVLQICIHLYCAITGVSHTQNPGYTLENPKWGERVVVLAIRPKKNKVFINMYPLLLCYHWGLSYRLVRAKIIKAFQWIPLSKDQNRSSKTHLFSVHESRGLFLEIEI